MEYMTEDTKIDKGSPITIYGRGLMKRFLVGIKNGRGFTEARILNAAGEDLEHRLGDGSLASAKLFNALRQVTAREDGGGNVTTFKQDHCNNVIEVTLPTGRKSCHTYNEKKGRTSDTQEESGLKITECYNYNILGGIK